MRNNETMIKEMLAELTSMGEAIVEDPKTSEEEAELIEDSLEAITDLVELKLGRLKEAEEEEDKEAAYRRQAEDLVSNLKEDAKPYVLTALMNSLTK